MVNRFRFQCEAGSRHKMPHASTNPIRAMNKHPNNMLTSPHLTQSDFVDASWVVFYDIVMRPRTHGLINNRKAVSVFIKTDFIQ